MASGGKRSIPGLRDTRDASRGMEQAAQTRDGQHLISVSGGASRSPRVFYRGGHL